jgi:Spy/CpxP family protein refolding chaperone
LGKQAVLLDRKSGVIGGKSMILKSLLVFVACAAVGTAAASPIAAQKPGSSAAQTGRGAGKTPAVQQGKAPDRPAPWWADEKSKKELGLTPEQVKELDDIYNSAKDELAADRATFDRERKELDKMIAESKAERWMVTRQIDKTETSRSAMNKLWIMTMYRMHQQLTPEQRVKLQSMADRDKGRGGRGGDRLDPKPAR